MDWETGCTPIFDGVGVVERSSSTAKGIGLCKPRLGVIKLTRSKSSSCNAVSMAFRTREDVAEVAVVCLVWSGPSDGGGMGGRDFEEATEIGLPGRSDCAEGLRFGKVLIEPVTDVPDDLELTLATLLALEDARLDNLDCGLVDIGVAGRDF